MFKTSSQFYNSENYINQTYKSLHALQQNINDMKTNHILEIMKEKQIEHPDKQSLYIEYMRNLNKSQHALNSAFGSFNRLKNLLRSPTHKEIDHTIKDVIENVSKYMIQCEEDLSPNIEMIESL